MQPSKESESPSPSDSSHGNPKTLDTTAMQAIVEQHERVEQEPQYSEEENVSFERDVAFERNQAFNRQSERVNSGLSLGGRPVPGLEVFTLSNRPVVDIDFSTFLVPVQPQLMPPTRRPQQSGNDVKGIIERLLSPPAHAFVHGVITLNWVIATAGAREFEKRSSDGRFVLKVDSLLRTKGREMGLPGMYWEWMCGDDEDEGAMFLTRGFFENEV